ncbi:MAG: SCO family protein, partial [Bacteroidota bacterium]
MRTSSITRWSTLAAYLALVLSGCHTATTSSDITVLPYYQEASFTPQWYATPRAVPAGFHSIPDFALVDQRGEVVSERDVAGKVYIANFFFAACPGICPMTMANMARVQAAFADEDEVLLISHSVTPERDSVAILHAFAERMQALNDRWYLVTGEREQIYQLGKYSYFADEDLGASDMNL